MIFIIRNKRVERLHKTLCPFQVPSDEFENPFDSPIFGPDLREFFIIRNPVSGRVRYRRWSEIDQHFEMQESSCRKGLA